MNRFFLSIFFRKNVAIVFLMGFLFVSSSKPAYAWDAVIGAAFHRAIDTLWDNIEGILKGIAKRLAVELAVRKANEVTGFGSKNSPTFITDYKQYLEQAVLTESMVVANDFLTETLGGKYSSLVYTVATGNLHTLGRSYVSYLAAEAQAGLSVGTCKYNLDQYSVDPIASLQRGNWRVFNAMIANPCNNPAGYSGEVRKFFQEDLKQRAERARVKAIANQGFVGSEKNGSITAPGILIKDLTAKVNALPYDLIAPANGYSEILTAAAGAFANTVMSNLVQRGFESVAKKVDRELGKVDKQVLDARKDIESQLGPGAYFFRNTIQQLGTGSTSRTGTRQGTVNFPTTPGTPGVCGTGATDC